MTLDVYARLEQRTVRSRGTAFDELVLGARGDGADEEVSRA
jgi:hypothetical protein